jgi:hypothetical protein
MGGVVPRESTQIAGVLEGRFGYDYWLFLVLSEGVLS